MATLDIRNNCAEITIDEIRFDHSADRLTSNGGTGSLFIDRDGYNCGERVLCRWEDFDSFIAACHKARELWGPKS